MASRDDVSSAVPYRASAECFEYECTPCAKDGRNTEAFKCCKKCEEYFCSLCLKLHDKYTKHHRTAEPSSMTRQSGQRVVMEMCHLHNDSTIDTYCLKHDVVCCSTCVSLKHRSCEGMEFIIDASKGVFKCEEYNDLPIMLNDLMARIETLKNMKQEDQHTLEKEKNACLQLIHETRRAMNARLDDLETTAKGSVMAKYEEIKDKINQDVNDLDKMEVKMKKSKDNLEKTNDHDNEVHAFARLKLGVHNRCEGGDLFRKIKSKPKRGCLEFEINSELKQFELTVESFGRPFEGDADEKILTASLISKQNVRIKSDATVCSLSAFIRLSDGNALVSDTTNNILKKLNKSYEVSDWCGMPGQPGGMANISHGEVAIALVEKEEIQFVTHKTKLKKARSFKVGNRCRDVAFHDDKLYIACGGGPNITSDYGYVTVYSLAGQLISKFVNDDRGTAMFKLPYKIHISSNSPVIHIADKRNGTVSLDMQGKYMSSFTDKDLQYPHGICSAIDGQLIVCGFRSNNVVQIGNKGDMIGVLLNKGDGISMPLSLYFEHKDSNLMVLMENSDVFHVYSLTT